MSVKEIERAIEALPPEDRAEFALWVEDWLFDQKIERDAKAGLLDDLAEEALADYHAGRTREI